MILEIDSAGPSATAMARADLQRLVRSWGEELSHIPGPDTSQAAGPDHRGDGQAGEGDKVDGDKVVDPVSVAALIVAIPSAGLAVADLADRITKRRRAQELIEHAQTQAAQQVTINILVNNAPVPLTSLDPDRLLDLLADQHADQPADAAQADLDR